MNEQLSTIDLGPFKKDMRQPFVIAFVYPQKNANFVVKGMHDSVTNYIERHFPNSIYFLRFYGKDRYGDNRWSWRSPLQLFFDDYHGRDQFEDCGRKHIHISMNTRNGFKDIATVRRVPRKWLPEYSEALPNA